MPFDYLSGFGSALDFDISSFSAADLASITSDLGSEFLSGVDSLNDLGLSVFASQYVPYEDIAGFGGYAQAGSFAGDAAWNNIYNGGSLVEAAGGVAVDTVPTVLVDPATQVARQFGTLSGADFVSAAGIEELGLSTAPSNLAGLNSTFISPAGIAELGISTAPTNLSFGEQLRLAAGRISTDFTGFVQGSQQLLQEYQKIAPLVNVVTAALKIDNPINRLIQPFQQVVGTADVIAKGAGAAANIRTTNTPNAVSTTGTTVVVPGQTTVPPGQIAYQPTIIQGPDGPIAVISPGSGVAVPVDPRATGFREITPGVAGATGGGVATPVVVDPQTQATYNTAVNTVQELTPSLQILRAQVEDQDILINENQNRIAALQEELDNNFDLSQEERVDRQLAIQTLEAETALLEEQRTQTSQLAFQTQTQLFSAERVIATVNQGVTAAPGTVPTALAPTNQAIANYNQALQTRENALGFLRDYQSELSRAEAEVADEQNTLDNLRSQLDNPNLDEEERARLELEIVLSEERLAKSQDKVNEYSELVRTTTDELFKAQEVIAATNQNTVAAPGAVPPSGQGTRPGAGQYVAAYDAERNTWSVYDTATNTTVRTGLTQQQALQVQQALGITAAGIGLNTTVTGTAQDPLVAAAAAVALASSLAKVNTAAGAVTTQNAISAALTDAARNQQAIRSLRNNKAQSSDWRVRLRLAPNSTYLYNDTQPGLLAPLKNTDGVIFPYTPSIETAYKANYDPYDLTHSNYRGYFYRNSYVDAINIRATFTAQDTNEANYLLAVIHFFRSCTKMFYGQDTLRGAPPPLVYLNGYGDFQFSEHPCVVSQFNYSLPPDVDYIRAQSVLSNNTNLQLARLRNSIANNPLSYSINRILNSGLLPGALDFRPATTNNLGLGNPTYVPTKMEISVSLLPIQSRAQISQNFSVKQFANGNLLRGGYW